MVELLLGIEQHGGTESPGSIMSSAYCMSGHLHVLPMYT